MVKQRHAPWCSANKLDCALPVLPEATLPAAVMQKALVALDAHGPELLAYPGVQAVGVGGSYDNPAGPAILLFVTKGQPRTDSPAQWNGVRTRIVPGDLFPRRGTISVWDERGSPAI